MVLEQWKQQNKKKTPVHLKTRKLSIRTQFYTQLSQSSDKEWNVSPLIMGVLPFPIYCINKGSEWCIAADTKMQSNHFCFHGRTASFLACFPVE